MDEAKKKKSFEGLQKLYCLPGKIVAFILAVIMTVLAIGSILVAIYMNDTGVYIISKDTYRRDTMEHYVNDELYDLLTVYMYDKTYGEQWMKDALSEGNIASMEISYESGDKWTYDAKVEKEEIPYTSQWTISQEREGNWFWGLKDIDLGPLGSKKVDQAEITIFLAEELTKKDVYYTQNRMINILYGLKYWIYGIIAFLAVIDLLLFIFLMKASGRKKNSKEIFRGWASKIPFDLKTLISFGCLAVLFMMVIYPFNILEEMICIFLMSIIFLGWCMSLATYIKYSKAAKLAPKDLWKKTFLYWIMKKCKVAACWLYKNMRFLFVKVPFIWILFGCIFAFMFIEILIVYNFSCTFDALLIFLIIKDVILIGIVSYVIFSLWRLQQGAKALADGDLEYKIDTDKLVADFKKHGAYLNSISTGMAVAVDERVKSERMKTELITNVSHDIKTPLTSIINYADLLEKEECNNEKIVEYIDVIHRQSNRLKRLIEDLIEASKAATGNLDINLEPCEVGVMLTQAAGEYEQKLSERQIHLLTKQPEEAVRIMADGRRLWRIFDNLLNNIYKYAQSGTRVYLTLEETDQQAIISFKNISEMPLDLSGDELMERFVQGDMSRKSEGNGLGLSIVKSLVELQNGTITLTTDGDLFKVVITFDKILNLMY